MKNNLWEKQPNGYLKYTGDKPVEKQLGLFDTPPMSREEEWKTFYGWDGPAEGEYGSIDTPVVEMADGGENVYAYMERVIFIRKLPDGRWLAEIRMADIVGKSFNGHWEKEGMRVILSNKDISPWGRWNPRTA